MENPSKSSVFRGPHPPKITVRWLMWLVALAAVLSAVLLLK